MLKTVRLCLGLILMLGYFCLAAIELYWFYTGKTNGSWQLAGLSILYGLANLIIFVIKIPGE